MIAGLPYDAEVEYLELVNNPSSSSGCYIDTGVVLDGSSSFSVIFSDCTSQGRWLCGSRKGFQNSARGFYTEGNTNTLDFRVAYGIAVWSGLGAYATTGVGRVIFSQEANVFTASQESGSGSPTTYTFTSQTFSSGHNFVIGGLNNDGRVISYSTFKLYGATIGGVRDMIPVRFTNESGQMEGAMYDRVTKKLFRNSGTGSFVIGPDVAKPVMGLHFYPSAPSAKDYVRDGLIAMWDGIENAGWGVHDTSRNIVNLATGKAYSLDDATDSQNVTIGDNYLQVTSPCSLYIPDLGWSLDAEIPRTFEIVWTNTVQNTTSNWNRAGWMDCGFVLSMQSQVAVLCRRSINGYESLYSGFATTKNKIETASAVTLGVANERRTYRNAQEISLKLYNWQGNITRMAFALFAFDSLAGSTSKIFTMRGYNRALTAAEIAANYEVDKIRFNLP